MRKHINSFIKLIVLVMFFAASFSIKTYAVEKEAQIANHQSDDDFVVNFQFDKEIVDITLISPSGKEFNSKSSGIQYAEGDLWCTFRIPSPEKGEWSIRYDLKRNTSIEYSVIEDNYGLNLKTFEKTEVEGDHAKFTIEADYNGENVYYNYTISAVPSDDNSVFSVIADGRAYSNKEEEVKADLSNLPSGEYTLRLDVKYSDGEIELTDALVLDEKLNFTNPNPPKTISDFAVRVNTYRNVVDVDWSRDFYGCSGSKIVIKCDDEVVYDDKFDDSVTNLSAQINEDTKKITVSLSVRYYNVWLSPLDKEIDLEKEGLSVISKEVTGDSILAVSYHTSTSRTIFTEFEGAKNQFEVSGEGELSFSLNSDLNHISLYFEADDNVTYYIDDDIVYDAYPPEIVLFEDYDGKRFSNDSVHLLGMINGGDKLLINGEEVLLDEKGYFDKEISLISGENTVELEAIDLNNNKSTMNLTLYYGENSIVTSSEDVKNGLVKYIPLLAGLIGSVIIIVLSLLFMKKKSPDKKGKFSILPWIIWIIILVVGIAVDVFLIIRRYTFTKSIGFLEMAEKSATEAANYIRTFRYMIIGAASGAVVLILSIVLAVLLAKRSSKKKMENTSNNNN